MLKIAYSKIYNHPLKENHRFPMIKYDLIPEQLVMENSCTENNFFEPGIVSNENILLTHDYKYYNRLQNMDLDKREIRAIGFPMSEELIKREKKIVQGTIESSLNAIKFGIAMNVAGGTHHAFTSRAEAFCILNDQAIASNFLIKNNYCEKILILDLDVHQGNGTAEIFRDNDKVFTVSFHGQKNYPFKKEKSDYDYGFNDGTNDKEYLNKIEYTSRFSINLLKKINKFAWKSIFYSKIEKNFWFQNLFKYKLLIIFGILIQNMIIIIEKIPFIYIPSLIRIAIFLSYCKGYYDRKINKSNNYIWYK